MFTTIQCTDIDDFIKRIEILKISKDLVFRGVSRKNYQIESTYERILKGNYIDHIDLTERRIFAKVLEIEGIKPTQNQFANLDDAMLLLAKMQHHGAPTRLIDWTHNPYVALYFANQSLNNAVESAIYVIDLNNIRNVRDSINEPIYTQNYGDVYEKMSESAKFFTNREMEVNYYEIKAGKIERLDKQSGLFLFSANMYYPFDNNFQFSRQNSKRTKEIYKFIFPGTNEIKEKNLQRLKTEQGIEKESLFPGNDYDKNILTQEAENFIREIFPQSLV